MIIQDFTRIIPKQGNEHWPSKLGLMGDLFRQAEYQMVKNGFRKAAIINLNPDNLQQFLDEVNKDSLLFTPLKKIAASASYSSIVKLPEPNQPFVWSGCITKTLEDAQKFKEADQKNDHKLIGKMLGYPDCCINYFIQTFPIDPVPIWIGLEGKVSGFPECNGMLRYFGPKITAHLSCSPTCQKTKEIGKLWLKTMTEIDKNLTNELYDLLSGPMIWDSYHGVVQIETPSFVGLNNALFILKKPRIINWRGLLKTERKKKMKRKKVE